MKKKQAFFHTKNNRVYIHSNMGNTNENSNVNLFLVRLPNKSKKKIEISHITNFSKRQLFCNFPILTEFLDKLLLKQLILSRKV